MRDSDRETAREIVERLFHHGHDIPYSEGNARHMTREIAAALAAEREATARRCAEILDHDIRQWEALQNRKQGLTAWDWIKDLVGGFRCAQRAIRAEFGIARIARELHTEEPGKRYDANGTECVYGKTCFPDVCECEPASEEER